MKSTFFSLLARKSVRWLLGIVLVIVLGAFLFGGEKPIAYETTVVARGDVTEVITATGQVRPKEFASLRFKTTGTIARLYADVGDVTFVGSLLASLDIGELSRKFTQAQAEAASSKVTLENAAQEISDQEIKGAQALTVLYTNAPNTLNEVGNLAEQAHDTFTSFFDASGFLLSSIRDVVGSTQRIVDSNNAFPVAKKAVAAIRSLVQDVSRSTPNDQLEAALAAVHPHLNALQSSLGVLSSTIGAIPAGVISSATLETYKSDLATARTNINTAITKESDLSSDISDTKIQNTLSVNTKKASQRSAAAAVEKSEASVALARQALSDAELRSPIRGTIAAKSKQLGEVVTTADQVYYVIGYEGLEIIANIPEVDIAKVSVGDTATVDLDAYEDGQVLGAKVIAIDPAETIVDGIATYKTTFGFDAPDPRVRSGMTATVAIETERRLNVLRIPQRAITNEGGSKIVRLPAVSPEAAPTESVVTTGLRGNDGMVEILSGLTEGSTIIVGTK